MYTLKAEKRNKNLKAKKLRALGFIPGSVYGKNITGTILLQIPAKEINQLLKTKSKGSKLNVEVDGEKYVCLLKDISQDPFGKIEHLGFQNLVADEPVNSAAQIVLLNREKNPHVIQQYLTEIPYRALPEHLIETVEIDLDGIKPGHNIKVEDLDIAKNNNIELLTEPDSIVLSIIEAKVSVEPTDEENSAEQQPQEDKS